MMPSVKEPLAGLALLVIFGFLIWYNRPIESPRLSDPYPQDQTPRFAGKDAYEAWLWQDPFGFDPDYGSGGAAEAWALAARRGKRDENLSTAIPAGLTCKASLKEALNLDKERSEEIPERIVLAPLVSVTPHTVENKEMRTRQRYAVVAGLVEAGYRPLEPESLNFCSIQENRPAKDAGEKDGRQKDRREYDMRWEHYRHESNGKSEDASKGSPKPDIVVAWIDSGIVTDESKFPANHPCTRKCDFSFKNLLKEISRNNKLYLFDVGNTLDAGRSCQIESHIGCIHDQNASSTGTKGIKKEAKSGNDGKIRLIKLAGMEDKEKQDKSNAEANAEPSDQESQGAGKESAGKPTEEPKQCGSKTTTEEAGSDKSASQATGGTGQHGNKKTGSEKLAGLLAKELTLRGVTKWSQVMTISEQNSENAAVLADNIRESLSELFAGQDCAKRECGPQKSDNGSPPGEIRNVFYLKSLDGNPKKSGDQDKKGKDKNEVRPADKTEKAPSIDLHHSPPLPVGSGQLDYFHRLAEDIKNVHHTVDFDKRDSGIRVVVILGSDFNDKLLIIEALREKMPHLLILTTDLDAQMLHPRHWRSTRNLVIASHFDLRLREKPKEDDNNQHFWQRAYQDQFPPFRDSQQTNIFYRTWSIATGDALSIEESKITFPQIYEVGRNGFVRLGTTEKNNTLDYHPSDNTLENTTKQLWLLSAIAVSLIILYWAIRPWSDILSRYLFGSAVFIIIIAFAFGLGTDVFGTNKPKEPLSLTDGVSLWSTLFIQITAGLLAVAFFIQSICELEGNFCRLNSRYFDIRQVPALQFPFCLNYNEPDECEPWLRRRLRSLGPSLGLSIEGWAAFVVLFIVLIGTIILYALNDVYPSELPFWRCFLILSFVGILYLIVIEVIRRPAGHISIKHWMEADNWSSSGQVNDERILWRQYYNHGRLVPRLIRVVWIWLVFAIIETLLAYLLPPWPLPWRGATDPASRIDMAPWTGVLSFTITMLLLFFILDAVRLNFYWIKKLRIQHPLLTGQPPGPVRRASRRRLERMVLLVAERTHAVDRLIYYPMFCIMLMLFAKITYFDNQEFPLSKGITFGAAISLLFLSGFVLRREANELRLCVKRRVRDTRVNSNTQEIDETLDRIDAIDEGAFQSMFEQPVMQALLIILASIGLFAGEYLKVFG